ncbi:hypothetical protein ACJZ2D_008706 [Fusarium nematophilum]
MNTRSCSPRVTHDDVASPMTETSSPLTNVMAPSALCSPVDSPVSQAETLACYQDLPSRISPTGPYDPLPIERKIDYDYYPEVVVPDDPEPAGIENPVTGYNLPEVVYSDAPEVVKHDVGICDGLEVVLHRKPSTRTVTPLHLLGDQPDWIDCPFCERRAMTTVKKKPSSVTHIQAAFLLVSTGPGVAAPYLAKWAFEIEQYCQNCENRVAYLSRGRKIHVCKAPLDSREPSRYAESN